MGFAFLPGNDLNFTSKTLKGGPMGRRNLAILIVIAMTFGWLSAQKTYQIKPAPETIHWGYFSADVEPVIRINPGDIVIIEDVPRLDPIDMEKLGIPAEEMSEGYRRIYREVTDKGPGPHIMVGPVYINGAEPGDVLEVRILEVELAYTFGYSRLSPSGGTLPGEFERWERILRIDLEKKTTDGRGFCASTLRKKPPTRPKEWLFPWTIPFSAPWGWLRRRRLDASVRSPQGYTREI
jgi:predicted RNA-binding protein with TRAM domain